MPIFGENLFLMNRHILLLALLCCGASAFAQRFDTIVQGNFAREWFVRAKAKVAETPLTAFDVSSAQPQPLPRNFMDTLQKYDWLQVGSFWFKDNSYRDEANECCQLHMERYGRANRQFRMSAISSPQLGSRIVFEQASPIPTTKLAQIGGKNYLITTSPKGEVGYNHLISYRNGVLMYDVSRTKGTPDPNSNMRFRRVYVAVPKYFGTAED